MDFRDQFNLNEALDNYTKHWKWFALSVIIALTGGYLTIRYTTPEYHSKAKLQILDEQAGASELSVFQDLSGIMGGGVKRKVEDEIEIIKSRSNLAEVVKRLGIHIRMKALGNIMDRELYGKPPVNISFLEADSTVYNAKFEFYLNIEGETKFGYSEDENEVYDVHSFGSKINTPVGDLVVTPTKYLEANKGKKLKISISPLFSVVNSYQKKINIVPATDYSNILNISLNDPVPAKAVDILENLMVIYNENDLRGKKEIADKTSSFIEERISQIYSNLSTVDQSAEDFKTQRGLTDVGSEANVNLNAGVSSRQELRNAETQLQIASSMHDYVSREGYDIVPSNLGLSDPTISNTAARYNELVLERNRLLKSSNEKNPIIVNLDQQLEGLKKSMMSALNSTSNNLNLQVNSLSKQVSQINSRLYVAPKNERALRDIARKQQTTEQLYLYLLQKREEAQIAFASATPKSEIVEHAHSILTTPIAPKKKMIFLVFLVLGLVIPFGVIYVTDLLDNKIHSKAGLEKDARDVPVLAELPRLGKGEAKLIENNDRSVLAESLRILRTNLDFMFKSRKDTDTQKGKVVFVTSSVPGEGKTFLSSNLTKVLAGTNKKVLLLGADIRNPKLYTFFGEDVRDSGGRQIRDVKIGLTEFLHKDSYSLKDIVQPINLDFGSVDVIYSGKIPPNPAELLMSPKLDFLFSELRERYDYIVVDTAPLMVVADTLLINKYSDQLLYVTRAGVTDVKAIEFPLKLKSEGKLNGLSFIVNDVKSSNLGYGGKYGYGYGVSQKKWWQF